MPSITSNIPAIIFYSSTISEFVKITRSTLFLKNFLPIAKNLLDQMIIEGGCKHMLLKWIKKALINTQRFSKNILWLQML